MQIVSEMKRMITIFSLTPLFHREESESEVAQSCLTLCDPMDCSLPGYSVHGIFKTRVLERVAFSFSRGSSQPRDWSQVSGIVGRHFYRLSHQGSPLWASLVAYLVKKKKIAGNVGDLGSIPGLGRSPPGEGKGNPLQNSGLENFMDCIVHGVPKSRTQLSDFHVPQRGSAVLKVLVTSQKSQSSWGQSLDLNQFTAIFTF